MSETNERRDSDAEDKSDATIATDFFTFLQHTSFYDCFLHKKKKLKIFQF
jgi:hypothetical protein